MIKYKEYQHVIIERGVSETQDTLHRKVLSAQAVAALGIFLRVFLKKHKLHNLIKEIDLGHFSWGLLDIWACYVIICFFFQILVQFFFFGLLFA